MELRQTIEVAQADSGRGRDLQARADELEPHLVTIVRENLVQCSFTCRMHRVVL